MNCLQKAKFLVVVYFFVVVWTILTALRLLWTIIKNPFLTFKKTKRVVPPACMTDLSLGKHEYVTANGIKFHCVTSGDGSKPLLLLLHGFPEFWFSWRHQIREFSKDYHVVAVDLRGYGETTKPPNVSDYTLQLLCQDIAELVPALGYANCILAGHDWGGAIAWEVATKHPDLVEKLIVLNCPHGKIFKKTITGSWSQFMKSWYMLLFQIPILPEFMLSMRDFSYFNIIFRGRKAGVRNRDAFPPDAVEAYKYVFSQPGALTPPINYIRNVLNLASAKDETRKKTIDTPTLLVWGDDDMFLESAMAEAHQSFVTNLTIKHIPKCSHWVQQDQPDTVNQFMRDFLTSE